MKEKAAIALVWMTIILGVLGIGSMLLAMHEMQSWIVAFDLLSEQPEPQRIVYHRLTSVSRRNMTVNRTTSNITTPSSSESVQSEHGRMVDNNATVVESKHHRNAEGTNKVTTDSVQLEHPPPNNNTTSSPSTTTVPRDEESYYPVLVLPDVESPAFEQHPVLRPKRESPACYPSFGGKTNISRIFLSHTRKAGGTTLRYFFKGLTDLLGWELKVVEGTLAELPNRTDTLYVVNLRDPVERIISNYKFEGRWDCRQMLFNDSFAPSHQNQRTLEEYVDSIQQQKCNPTFLWTCVEECYIKWYGRDYGCKSNVTDNYQFAYDRLNSYDIIVTPHFLEDESYVKKLESMFGNVATGMLQSPARIFCSEPSINANKEFPMREANATTMALLKQWNILDTQIYKDLTGCS